jgi:hypothetical protein
MLADKKIHKIRLYFEASLLKINLSSPLCANTFLSCKSFVQCVLSKQLRQHSSAFNPSDYGLFERSSGIERLIESSTNIFDLENLLHKSDSVVYFIRKKSSIESNSTSDHLTQSQRSKIKRFFKRSAAANSTTSLHSHKYSEVVDKFVVKNTKEGYRYCLSIRVVTKKVYDRRARTKVVDNSVCGSVSKDNYIRSSCKEKIVYIKEKLIKF